MKRFLIFLLPVLLIMLFQSPVFALADVANKSIDTIIEDDFQVTFMDSVHFTLTDSTNNLTTVAIEDAGWLDWENATLRVYGNAASGIDVNVTLLGGGSLDLTYMGAEMTQTEFDAAGSATPSAAETWI